MNINRHNYEEHFILYWDNELTSSQKQAVENFVKENQDLEEEFKVFGQTRFVTDHNIQLEEKGFLINDSFINITNYEEQLLSYIDDELSAEQRKEVERFAGQYSAVKQELALLQKTKLQPEAQVVFPDKSILYRREEKVRVISMTWFRVAVAAAIIIIAGFATFRLVSNNTSSGKIDIAKGTETKTNSLDQSTDHSKVVSGDKTPTNSQSENATVKSKTVPVQSEKKNQKLFDSNNNTIASYKRENKNNLPEEKKGNDNTIPDPIEAIDIIAAIPNNEIQKIESDKTNDLFSKTSVTNPNRFTSDIIVDDGIDGSSTKDGGGIKEFLRKTTRVFERRTKINTTTDDNKLLVGAFAVSLK